MTILNLDISPETMTLDDLIALEEMGNTAREIRDFVARLVPDENGERMDAEPAQALVGAMSLSDLEKTMDQVRAAVNLEDGGVSGEAEGS